MVTLYRVALPAHGQLQVASGSSGKQVLPVCVPWARGGAQVQAVYRPSVLKSAAVPQAHAPTLLTARRVVVSAADSGPLLPPPPAANAEVVALSTREIPPSTGDVGHGPGDVLRIGTRAFELVRELGRGSFGVVWDVQEEGQTMPLALKCSTTTTPRMLEACLLESEILQQLSAALSPELRAACRVPTYVAHCAGHSPTGESQVLLAMARLQGQPLDRWLHGVDENSAKRLPPAELVDGLSPGGRHATCDLTASAAIAAALVGQLAPVFAALGGIAYHRDVSAHNLLVRGEAGAEEFALLDFGLAVRSATWESDYKTRNISGDPRYFTPAAWMLLVHGLKYLRGHPDSSFLNQYRCRLDHFSFGVVVLEVFFALWKGPELDGLQDLDAAKAQTLRDAWSAWRAFWTNAICFFQLFHAEGAAATRERLARTQGLSSYVDNLRTLCSALRSAAEHMPGTLTSVVHLHCLHYLLPAYLLSPAVSNCARIFADGSSTWAQLPGVLAAASSCAGETGKGAARSSGSEAAGNEVHGSQHLHRRYWSVDAAASLTRNVPELAVGSGPASEGRGAAARAQATTSMGPSRLSMSRKG